MDFPTTKYEPKTEVVHQKWVGMSNYFAKNVEPITLSNSLQNFDLLISLMSSIGQKFKIIELGCGSGLFCKNILDNYGSLIQEYTLVDISEIMVDLAKTRLKEYAAGDKYNLIFESLSMDNLDGILSDSYDIVVSNYCIHLVAHPEDAFKEVKRILKPRGYFSASVLGHYENSQRFGVLIQIAQEKGAKNDDPNFYIQYKYGYKEVFSAAGEQVGLKTIHTKIFYDEAPLMKEFAAVNIEGMKAYLMPGLDSDMIKSIAEEYQKRLEIESGEGGIVTTQGVYAVFQKPHI